MRIALAQFNPTVGDFEGNSSRILTLAAEAKRRGAELAVFSELCICGYLPLDLLERPAFICEGRVVFEQSKMLLPTYDVFDESRYFQPGEKQYVYGMGREQLGITVCEDVWNDKTFWSKPLYVRDPVTELVSQGASVLINLSASPYTIDKRFLRVDM